LAPAAAAAKALSMIVPRNRLLWQVITHLLPRRVGTSATTSKGGRLGPISSTASRLAVSSRETSVPSALPPGRPQVPWL
jgi:hypothetical protein